ncbi:hypothetical protein CEE37_05380 [candidate division LCP-89 bacterium B3_LCP]|uniref:Smf/DprA SLOG domain-containing protein n=1 Tax=candidate division LCP-89 bacterium B3_LCP TaxID=2012998 RepID=A0A532V1L8_UNCL8|nr:MAG: hypothetical protein CEE37_05380 [candidate division LCP-89 bacterium B3_LCP]
MEEKIYWVHLASIEGLGGAIFDQLVRRFGSLKRALEAPLNEIQDIPGLDERTAEAICRAGQTLDATEAKVKELTGKGVKIITNLDAEYPGRLREATNPSPLLYQVGDLKPQDDSAVAIIGSRDCSEVSQRRAQEYAEFFAGNQVTVVSGYATGVDINGHLGALKGEGRTLIIPGCGINKFDIGPLKDVGVSDWTNLGDKVVVISEQPPESDWMGQACTARNRLVAAQAKAVLVMEAKLHSSTLDTVSHAKKLGRPVFVQSFGTVSEKVMGNEMLRKEGAGVINTVDDLTKIVEVVRGKEEAGDLSTRGVDPRC